MKLRGAVWALAALLPAAGAAAACPERSAWRSLDFGGRVEQLSPSSPDWTDVFLEYQDIYGPRTGWLARITQSSRFGQDDTTAALGGHFPLTPADTVSLEGSYAPSANVLAESSLQGSWNHAWGGGWGTQLGVRQTRFTNTTVTVGEAMLERYVGNFRFAYSYVPSDSTTAGSADGHRLQGGYFYGSFSSVQAILAAGTEVDIAGSTTVTATDVRSAALFGVQELSCDWGLGWNVGYTENRGLGAGNRRGAGLFIRRRF